MVFTGRMTEAERGMHMEGDTPDSSEHAGDIEELDDELSSYDSEFEDTFERVLSRREEDGRLEYWVRFANGDEEWMDRSDLWDWQTNTLKIVAYDKAHPIAWDEDCQFCLTPFSQRGGGCEECRCPECKRACCHLQGVNYGCVKHPVI
jgi:hypothetical protein